MGAVHWDFNGSIENESALKPLCEQVDRHFPLASDRYYRYFAVPNDAVDDEFLAGRIGRHFRGLHVPASGTDDVSQYLQIQCFPQGAAKNYDNLVFIRHSTCADPTGCVITYAHELQHILQERRFPRLMEVGTVLRWNLRTFEPGATEIDLPCEVDANIVSKRVAETVCGVEPVKGFAEQQLRKFTVSEPDSAQEKRWRFFLNLPFYDWVNETVRLVNKYRGRMDFMMDVDTPGWWKASGA